VKPDVKPTQLELDDAATKLDTAVLPDGVNTKAVKDALADPGAVEAAGDAMKNAPADSKLGRLYNAVTSKASVVAGTVMLAVMIATSLVQEARNEKVKEQRSKCRNECQPDGFDLWSSDDQVTIAHLNLPNTTPEDKLKDICTTESCWTTYGENTDIFCNTMNVQGRSDEDPPGMTNAQKCADLCDIHCNEKHKLQSFTDILQDVVTGDASATEALEGALSIGIQGAGMVIDASGEIIEAVVDEVIEHAPGILDFFGEFANIIMGGGIFIVIIFIAVVLYSASQKKRV
jgi:hypothetical protein